MAEITTDTAAAKWAAPGIPTEQEPRERVRLCPM